MGRSRWRSRSPELAYRQQGGGTPPSTGACRRVFQRRYQGGYPPRTRSGVVFSCVRFHLQAGPVHRYFSPSRSAASGREGSGVRYWNGGGSEPTSKSGLSAQISHYFSMIREAAWAASYAPMSMRSTTRGLPARSTVGTESGRVPLLNRAPWMIGRRSPAP